jgi:hypothetical protein
VARCVEATRVLSVLVGGAHASIGMLWASWARVCLVDVWLLSGNGGYQLVQGIKGRQNGMVARV